jgi:hypothetical protein
MIPVLVPACRDIRLLKLRRARDINVLADKGCMVHFSSPIVLPSELRSYNCILFATELRAQVIAGASLLDHSH